VNMQIEKALSVNLASSVWVQNSQSLGYKVDSAYIVRSSSCIMSGAAFSPAYSQGWSMIPCKRAEPRISLCLCAVEALLNNL
jgi:hypothetical protein